MLNIPSLELMEAGRRPLHVRKKTRIKQLECQRRSCESRPIQLRSRSPEYSICAGKMFYRTGRLRSAKGVNK